MYVLWLCKPTWDLNKPNKLYRCMCFSINGQFNHKLKPNFDGDKTF